MNRCLVDSQRRAFNVLHCAYSRSDATTDEEASNTAGTDTLRHKKQIWIVFSFTTKEKKN